MEGHHAARLRPGDLPEAPDLATIDCSFISVAKVLPAVAGLIREGGLVIALVKPQFEAGPRAAPRGVVRDPAVHQAVLRGIVAGVGAVGFAPVGVVASPLLGPQGNREFFLILRRGGHGTIAAVDDLDEAIARVVRGEPVTSGSQPA